MNPWSMLSNVGRRPSLWPVLAPICLTGWALPLAAQSTNELPAVIQPDGTISVPPGVQFPPYSKDGTWVEDPGNTSDRYVTRHFRFMIPHQSPALELFRARARSREKPDGAFEIGSACGFVAGFADNAGFTADELVLEDCTIGSAKAKRCRVRLVRDLRPLWIYVYVRQPSFTFISVRLDPNALPVIEHYLATVRLN